jgi:hypothetical protein
MQATHSHRHLGLLPLTILLSVLPTEQVWSVNVTHAQCALLISFLAQVFINVSLPLLFALM